MSSVHQLPERTDKEALIRCKRNLRALSERICEKEKNNFNVCIISKVLVYQIKLCRNHCNHKEPSTYHVIQILGPGKGPPPPYSIVIDWEEPPPPCNIVINFDDPSPAMLYCNNLGTLPR